MKTWGKTKGGRLRAIRPAVLAAVALGVALSALGGEGPASAAGRAVAGSAIEPMTVEAAVAPVVVARYTFDTAGNGAGSGTVADDSGHGHTLTPSAGHGGKVRLAELPGKLTRAADFPARCAGKRCPHAVLQTPDAPELNPGAGPVRYGATVRLTRRDTGSGQNIVQKGYSAAGSQYKLQIDGAAGRPSCVFADAAVHAIHVAMSDVSVSDGVWHRLECRRSGADLTVLVDDVVRGTATLPATLSVVNTVPLSIGGKGNGLDNDQFHGNLDDVWIARG